MPNLSSFASRKEFNAYFRAYREKNRKKIRAYYRKYNSEWRKLNGYHNERNSILRYPEKDKARKILQYAVKSGRVIRGKCEKCGKKKTHAHHTDYSKPLDVKWLCPSHHAEIHRLSP